MLPHIWRAFQQRTNKLIARSSKNDSAFALLKHKDLQRLSNLKAVFHNLQNHLASVIPEMEHSTRGQETTPDDPVTSQAGVSKSHQEIQSSSRPRKKLPIATRSGSILSHML